MKYIFLALSCTHATNSLQTSPAPQILLSSATRGGFWLIFLFILSFALIHIAKLAEQGWSLKKNASKNEKSPKKDATNPKSASSQSTKNNEKAPANTPQEPIYYIVERKRKHGKNHYSEPKEIRFKE